MKATTKTKLLSDAVARLKTICGKTTTLPILGNVLITAEKGTLSVYAQNMETEIRVNIEGQIATDGAFTVPCNRLASWLAAQSGAECIIKASDKDLTLQCGSSRVTMGGLPADEMPPKIEQSGECEVVTLGYAELKTLLDNALVFASIETARAALMAVNIFGNDGKMAVIATDGRRAIFATTQHEMKSKKEYIVPTESAVEISKLCQGGEVILSLAQSTISAECGNVRLVSKLLEISYPNWKNFVPEDEKRGHRYGVDKAVLVSSINSALALAPNGSRVDVNIEGSEMHVAGLGQDFEASDSIPCSSESDTAFFINGGFLKDAAKCYGPDILEFRMADPTKPVTIQDGNTLMLIQSMFVTEKSK